jgi:hypothetical protein
MAFLVQIAHAQPSVPQFRAYPAGPIYNGPHAPAKIVTEKDRDYRTRVREAATLPVNFAGHYHLETWGCGTGQCTMGVVVDVITGDVTFLPFSVCCSAILQTDDNKFNSVEFRNNSKLIIFSGLRNEDGVNGAHFYVFEGESFSYLKTILRPPPPPQAEAN